VEPRLASLLERIYQADAALRRVGRDPDVFLLVHGGVTRQIQHPRWDPSWAVPTAADIDDLKELGYLRTEANNAKRKFTLTVRGRAQGEALAAARQPPPGSGRAPALGDVLAWLGDIERSAPEAFDLPGRLIDRAVSDGLIESSGPEALAQRLFELHRQDYLGGEVPDLDQLSAEQLLGRARNLELTMKAHDRLDAARAPQQAAALNFYGSVVAGQIAAGSISNYLSVGDLLDRAEEELDRLEGVDEAARSEARELLAALPGRASTAGGLVLIGAGGALLAEVLGQLLGLSPG
jgi:hypothetical protein